MNHVNIMGRLVADPKIRYTDDHRAVVSITVAIDSTYQREHTDFVDVTGFGKTGQFIGNYFVRGKMIALDGHLRQEKWTAQDGSKRAKIAVIADSVYFVGKSDKTQQTAADTPTTAFYVPQRTDANDDADGEVPF